MSAFCDNPACTRNQMDANEYLRELVGHPQAAPTRGDCTAERLVRRHEYWLINPTRRLFLCDPCHSAVRMMVRELRSA